MKKISTLIFLTCCFLSCSHDDEANKSPLEGKWYYQEIIYADFASDRGVSSEGNLVDCMGDSYYDVSGSRVQLKEFSSCEKLNTFQGTFDSKNNKIVIGNRSTEYIEYDIQMENEKLVLTATTTSVIDNELWTHTVTQICGRQPIW